MDYKITMTNNQIITGSYNFPLGHFINDLLHSGNDNDKKLINDKLVRLPNGVWLNPSHISTIEQE